MPITIHDHLKHNSNRSLLILLSESFVTHILLDEQDCCEALRNYGSIKKIQLTDDRRAAFVDFECEHAPLLVARCFELGQSNLDVPMPKGVTTLLPGCSINNYLYLHHVPRSLSNTPLFQHFSKWNNDRPVTVIRPGSDLSLSSRVVIVLSKGFPATSFTQNQIRLDVINFFGKPYQFYAIPPLEQLTNSVNVCDNNGCKECTLDARREWMKIEGEKRMREAAACEHAQKEARLKRDQNDYSTPRGPLPIFLDITEESERRRWGIIDQKQVSPPIPPPTNVRPSCKEEVLDWKNWEDPKKIRKEKEPPLPSSFPISVTSKPSFTSFDTKEPDGKNPAAISMKMKKEKKTVFANQKISISPHPMCITMKPSFTSFDTKEPDVIKPPAVLSMKMKEEEEEKTDCANQISLSSLPSTQNAQENARETPELSIPKGILKKRQENSVWTNQYLTTNEKSLLEKSVRFDGSARFDCRPTRNAPVVVPREAEKEEKDKNPENEKKEDIGEAPNAPVCVPREAKKEEKIKENREIEKKQEKGEGSIGEEPKKPLRDANARGIEDNEDDDESRTAAIIDYLDKESNRCLLILIGKTKLFERDCSETLRQFGSIKKIQLNATHRVAFVEFHCNHAPMLAVRYFRDHQMSNRVRLPKGVAAVLPGCSIDSLVYVRVPPSLPPTALQMHISNWCRGGFFTVHRSGSSDSSYSHLPSQHVVIELIGGIAASLFQKDKVMTREVMFNGTSHLIFAVPHNSSFTDTSSLIDVDCTKCKIPKFHWMMETEEKQKKISVSDVARDTPLNPIQSTREKPDWVSNGVQATSPPSPPIASSSPPIPPLRSLSIDEPLEFEKSREQAPRSFQGDQSTPITISDYISQQSNRCLLIVIGKTKLDERDCSEKLGHYCSIKQIEFTSDCRAAFVEFDCSHAPLLVARCFGYKQAINAFPMPKGVASLLPACSIENYLYLRVPSSLPTVALRDYMTDWCKGRDFIIHRPVTDSNPSSHVVIRLSIGVTALSFHLDRMKGCELKFNGSSHKFYAIPLLKSLVDTSSVFATNCFKCNISEFRPIAEVEERRKKAMKTAAVETRDVRVLPQRGEDEVIERREERGPGIDPSLEVQITSVEDQSVHERGEEMEQAIASIESPQPVSNSEFQAKPEVASVLEVLETTETTAVDTLEKEEKQGFASSLEVQKSSTDDQPVTEREEMEEESMIDPFVNEYARRTVDVPNETQSTIDYESDNGSAVFADDLEGKTKEVDSDELLSGEEDQWTSVGPHPFSRLSLNSTVDTLPDIVGEEKAHDFAASDCPPIVMMVEEDEEENDMMRDIIERMSAGRPTASHTVSLENEDTDSSLLVTESSDEETINSDHVSDSSTVSYECSDTVVTDGEYGRFAVDPADREEDRIVRGIKSLSAIEEKSQEEDALSSMCTTQEVTEEVEEKRYESIDGGKKEEEVSEGKSRATNQFFSSISSLDVSMSEEVKEKMDIEQRDGVPSSAPIRQWSKTSVVDQEEDCAPTESEYHKWLTREEPKTREESEDGTSSDSESELVPLPSSLPFITWGAGMIP